MNLAAIITFLVTLTPGQTLATPTTAEFSNLGVRDTNPTASLVASGSDSKYVLGQFATESKEQADVLSLTIDDLSQSAVPLVIPDNIRIQLKDESKDKYRCLWQVKIDKESAWSGNGPILDLNLSDYLNKLNQEMELVKINPVDHTRVSIIKRQIVKQTLSSQMVKTDGDWNHLIVDVLPLTGVTACKFMLGDSRIILPVTQSHIINTPAATMSFVKKGGIVTHEAKTHVSLLPISWQSKVKYINLIEYDKEIIIPIKGITTTPKEDKVLLSKSEFDSWWKQLADSANRACIQFEEQRCACLLKLDAGDLFYKPYRPPYKGTGFDSGLRQAPKGGGYYRYVDHDTPEVPACYSLRKGSLGTLSDFKRYFKSYANIDPLLTSSPEEIIESAKTITKLRVDRQPVDKSYVEALARFANYFEHLSNCIKYSFNYLYCDAGNYSISNVTVPELLFPMVYQRSVKNGNSYEEYLKDNDRESSVIIRTEDQLALNEKWISCAVLGVGDRQWCWLYPYKAFLDFYAAVPTIVGAYDPDMIKLRVVRIPCKSHSWRFDNRPVDYSSEVPRLIY